MKAGKTAKQMERHLKGVANHRRIEVLLLLARRGNLTLDEIVTSLEGSYPTLGEHVRRLALAGLVDKRYRGRHVEHSLSPYGRLFVKFLKSFQEQ